MLVLSREEGVTTDPEGPDGQHAILYKGALGGSLWRKMQAKREGGTCQRQHGPGGMPGSGGKG